MTIPSYAQPCVIHRERSLVLTVLVSMLVMLTAATAGLAKSSCEGPVVLDRVQPYSEAELDALLQSAQKIDSKYGYVTEEYQELAVEDLSLVGDTCDLLRRKATVYESAENQFTLKDGAATSLGAWRPRFLNVSGEAEGAKLLCHYEDSGLEEGIVLHSLIQAWIQFPDEPRSYYVDFNFGGLIAIDREGNIRGGGVPSVLDVVTPKASDWTEANCRAANQGSILWSRCHNAADSNECDSCCDQTRDDCRDVCRDLGPHGAPACYTGVTINYLACGIDCAPPVDAAQITLQSP